MSTSPLVVDADDILQVGIASLQSSYPAWRPIDSSYDYRLLRAFATMVAEAFTNAADVPDEIIQTVGRVVYRTAPFAATAAAVPSTWTVTTSGGFEIEAGWHVALTDSGGVARGFTVQAPVTIASGQTSTTAGEVILVADEPGTDSNDLGGTATPLDNIAEVATVTTVGTSADGTDAETAADYEARIRKLARLIAPRPILPDDFAAAASLLVPGTRRTLAVDNLNGDTLATGQERCVTVFTIDALGADESDAVKDIIKATLAAMREDTFEVFVNDPNRTAVTVAFTGVKRPGYNAPSVQAAAIAAVQSALSPAVWGTTESGDLSTWEDDTIVRFQDIVTVLNNVAGFDHYTALTLNGGTADVTLGSYATLPTPTVTGTVT